MATSNFEKGYQGFAYALANDALTAYYCDHAAVRQYMYNLARKLEKYGDSEAPEDVERRLNTLEEATGAANELARAIKRTDPETFAGFYRQVLDAVYDDLGLPR